MLFCMALVRNQAMLCFARRAISRPALLWCNKAHLRPPTSMTSDVAAPAAESAAANGHGEAHSTASFKALLIGCIGVVYGDIGTSPLYALREAVVAASGPGHDELTRPTVLGVVSLILWALFVIVTLKYVVILLRADNNGEGGTLTLMALASRAVNRIGRSVGYVALL